jgi:hypothetical protein
MQACSGRGREFLADRPAKARGLRESEVMSL